MGSRSKRLLVATSVTIGAVMVSATAAAHVTIDTYGDVSKGGFGKLGFSVPNERDDAGTVALEVQMPRDRPLVFVSVQPKPGWKVETSTRTLSEPVEAFGASYDTVVDSITWTADEGVRIGPGQFDIFWVSVGPLPDDVDALGFPAVQTYDSGEEVRWIEATPPGGEEPEHPSPTVALASSGEAGGENDDSNDSSLSIVALVVGGLGLLVAGAALVTGRRRAHEPQPAA